MSANFRKKLVNTLEASIPWIILIYLKIERESFSDALPEALPPPPPPSASPAVMPTEALFAPLRIALSTALASLSSNFVVFISTLLRYHILLSRLFCISLRPFLDIVAALNLNLSSFLPDVALSMAAWISLIETFGDNLISNFALSSFFFIFLMESSVPSLNIISKYKSSNFIHHQPFNILSILIFPPLFLPFHSSNFSSISRLLGFLSLPLV